MSKARDEVAMIKFVVANTMNRILDRSLQIHGGLGMSDDTILAYWFRHERAARIYDGADEVHKASLGKRVLREYRSRGKNDSNQMVCGGGFMFRAGCGGNDGLTFCRSRSQPREHRVSEQLHSGAKPR